MANENKNLALYEELRAVPTEAQKSFTNGRFSGTDINPMWRIKKLTEVFGPCGIGWYTEIVNRSIETASNGSKCSFVSINLFVKHDGEWSKPIYGEGGNKFETLIKDKYTGEIKKEISDEAFKMAYTDALSNSAKALGLGADIWFANDKQHGTKYDVQQENYKLEETKKNVDALKAAINGKEEEPVDPVQQLVNDINKCTKSADVVKIWNAHKDLQSNDAFKTAVKNKGSELKSKEAAA